MALFAALIGGLAGLGLLVLRTAWSPPSPGRVAAPVDHRRLARAAVAAVAGALFALVLTGWVAAAIGGACGAFAAARALDRRRRSTAAEQERIGALASWCEQLRDLLTAEHGIVGTIATTARTCPEPIRPEVMRLATRISRGDPGHAIRELADELDDPSADLVASVLLLAISRSSRTSELLSELATTIRERAAMRLRIEAERSGQRSEARFIIGFSAVAITAVLIFGRESEFLDAYDGAAGQLVLAFVIGCFAVGGWWMAKLTRFERPARFLTVSEEA